MTFEAQSCSWEGQGKHSPWCQWVSVVSASYSENSKHKKNVIHILELKNAFDFSTSLP